jgi:hypothetical protein
MICYDKRSGWRIRTEATFRESGARRSMPRLAQNPDCTHPMKEDVKKNSSPSSSRGHEAGSLHPALPPY